MSTSTRALPNKVIRVNFLTACLIILRVCARYPEHKVLAQVNVAKMLWGFALANKLDKTQRGRFDAAYEPLKNCGSPVRYITRAVVVQTVERHKAQYGHLMAMGVPATVEGMLELLAAGKELSASEDYGDQQLGLTFLAFASLKSCLHNDESGIALAFIHQATFDDALTGRPYGQTKATLLDAVIETVTLLSFEHDGALLIEQVDDPAWFEQGNPRAVPALVNAVAVSTV